MEEFLVRFLTQMLLTGVGVVDSAYMTEEHLDIAKNCRRFINEVFHVWCAKDWLGMILKGGEHRFNL